MTDYYLQYGIIFIILLLLRELFTYKKNLSLKYFFTPLVTVAIIITALSSLQIIDEKKYILLIIAGLVFSLIGDTILMIEEYPFFTHGLIFFLFAQIAYSFALIIDYDFHVWNIAIGSVLIAVIIVFNIIIKSNSGKYEPMIFVYSIVISCMLFLAVAHVNFSIINFQKGLLMAIGALLFVVSDIIIAVNKFIKEIPHSSVIVWLLYAPSQFLISLSCYYN